MAVQNNIWEADKMLDVYIYDFLKKRKMEESAKAFLNESNLTSSRPATIDAPGGFLLEWWSVFWDVFMVRSGQKHSEIAASYVQSQQLNARESQQQLQAPRFSQRMQNNHLQGPVLSALNGFANPGMQLSGGSAILRQSNTLSAEVYVAKKNRRQRETIGNAFINGPLLHSGAIASTAVKNDRSMHGANGISYPELVLGPSVFGAPMETADDQSMKSNLLSSPGFLNNQGDACLVQPLKDWPTTKQRPQMISTQSLDPFAQSSPQYSQMQQALCPQMEQQVFLHNKAFPGQAQRMLIGRSGLSSSGREMMQTSGIDFSQGAGSLPSMSQGSLENRQMYIQMVQMQQQHRQATLPQLQLQRQLQLQQDRLSGVGANSQNGRKRKSEPASSSGPANSSGTTDNATPSSNSAPPDSQSTGMGIQQQQLLQFEGQLGGVCLSTPIQMGFANQDGNDADRDPHLDPYLPALHECTSTTIAKQNPSTDMSAEVNTNPRFSFSEVGCLRASTSKVLCCHFSLDGNLLASGGHDKKVNLWNVGALKLEHTLEEHSLIITDVRFNPTSTRLATSSFDKTVRIWDVANPAYSMRTFQGHTNSVMSLDFHPNNEDLLCTCDGDSQIRYWSVSQGVCVKSFKGGVTQLRFQPRIGRFLAAAAENVVSIFDVESDSDLFCLLNHSKPVCSVCWSESGDLLASLTEDYVKVWQIGCTSEGDEPSKCIHELGCNGKKFHSCVFHPNYPSLLIIGCYQSMELWNMVENKSMTVAAHDGLIESLASSPATGLVATASHDKCVKLWQ